MARPDVSSIRSLLSSSQSVALLLPAHPSYDAVSAILALKLSFDAVGKSTLVACPDPIIVEFNRLIGIDTVTSMFGGRDLIIAFPEQTEHVDKVTYNIEAGELRLVVPPKQSAPTLDHRRLKFISGSHHADAIMLVDVDSLTDLGHIYEQGKEAFRASEKMVSLTRNLPAQNYTPHQVYDPLALSLSELVVYLIESLSLPLPADAATNLLAGLERATQNFQHPEISASAFETAARLIKSGARRHADQISAADFPSGSIPASPGTAESVAEIKGPPDDWMAPKVYRGPMLQ